jgi:hypothetical protein
MQILYERRYFSKLLKDGVHMRYPTVMVILPPARYTWKYSDLQIISIRDVGSCRDAKCVISHYLVCMTN